MSPGFTLADVEIMRPCLLEATAAGVDGEVPVGAVVIRKGIILGGVRAAKKPKRQKEHRSRWASSQAEAPSPSGRPTPGKI